MQAAYDAFMAGIPEGAAKTAGKAVGTTVAAGMLAWRTGDHSTTWSRTCKKLPVRGLRADRTDDACGHETALRAALHIYRARYRPDAPYRDDLAEALATRRYAEDVAELKELGRATGSSRTPEQTETAHFHSAPTYLQFSQALRGLVTTEALDLRESARLWATPGWRPGTR